VRTLGLAVVALIVSFGIHECYVRMRGIQVCVRNVDSRPLRGDVILSSSTANRAHSLGELAPGKGACVWVQPVGEATIELTLTSEATSKTVEIEGYVETSAHGSISVDVTADGVRRIDRRVSDF